METRQELASRVHPARKERRWTQKELAAKAGVSLGVVSALERGTATPQVATLTAVVNALGIQAEPSTGAVDGWEWSPDVAVVLDVIGLYLESFEPPMRAERIREMTRRIVARTL